MRLKGALAVVSGAAGGIGAATVRLFAREGARVAALDLDEPDVGDLRLRCDVSDDRSVTAAAVAVRHAFGDATVLVHAAAVQEYDSTLEASPESFARTHDVNVGGALRLVRAFVPAMVKRGAGSVLMVSSINGARATPGLAAYAASKGALDTFMRTLALEVAPAGVRVNAVAPASVDTPLLRASFDRNPDPRAALAANVGRHPLGRLGTTDDVAHLLLFLASNEASWITGAIVPIDGGASLTRR